MSILYIIWLFVLWTLFWSFGSVILTRMRYKITRNIAKWFVAGRSKCPECKHVLQWYDLIPIYSWFRTRGRCSHCGSSVSSMYPTLEIVSGLIFAWRGVAYLLPWLSGIDSLHLGVLVAWWLLGLLLIRDIYTYELHVPVWFGLIMVEVVYAIVALIGGFATRSMVVLPLVFFGFFLIIYRLGKRYVKYRFGQRQEWFGQWDVMLAPLLGFLFAVGGFSSSGVVDLVLVFVLGSSFVGLLYYFIAWLVHYFRSTKSKRHSTWSAMIPFLPAMIVSYWIILIIHMSNFWFM